MVYNVMKCALLSDYSLQEWRPVASRRIEAKYTNEAYSYIVCVDIAEHINIDHSEPRCQLNGWI